MRYIAAASPAFLARHFSDGVTPGSLALAPSLVFNNKDELQARWVRRLCHRHVDLPRHTLPSSQAFVTAALAGMGWGLHPQALIAPLLWQETRVASVLLDGLSCRVLQAAQAQLQAL